MCVGSGRCSLQLQPSHCHVVASAQALPAAGVRVAVQDRRSSRRGRGVYSEARRRSAAVGSLLHQTDATTRPETPTSHSHAHGTPTVPATDTQPPPRRTANGRGPVTPMHPRAVPPPPTPERDRRADTAQASEPQQPGPRANPSTAGMTSAHLASAYAVRGIAMGSNGGSAAAAEPVPHVASVADLGEANPAATRRRVVVPPPSTIFSNLQYPAPPPIGKVARRKLSAMAPRFP